MDATVPRWADVVAVVVVVDVVAVVVVVVLRVVEHLSCTYMNKFIHQTNEDKRQKTRRRKYKIKYLCKTRYIL
jgi:hypothetical protein